MQLHECLTVDSGVMFHPVGNTPLFKSTHLSQAVGCCVYIKADYLNPGMSSKDRPALYMIQEAVKDGRLHPGDTIVEASSGNTAIGRYLKSRNRDVCIMGVDPVGSVLHDYFRTGKIQPAGSYMIEGIGRSFLPGNLDVGTISDICEVSDAQAVEAAWRFKDETGFLSGFSSAACIAALMNHKHQFRADDHVVLFFADHGSRYLSKLYNELWLEEYIPSFRGMYA